MANAIGYEEVRVGAEPVGLVAKGRAASSTLKAAVFLVDPDAPVGVRWRPDTKQSPLEQNAQVPGEVITNFPRADSGLPLGPGRWIVVAGESAVRQSMFIRAKLADEPTTVHVLYFDQAHDIVAADFGGEAVLERLVRDLIAVQKDVLDQEKKQTEALEYGTPEGD